MNRKYKKRNNHIEQNVFTITNAKKHKKTKFDVNNLDFVEKMKEISIGERNLICDLCGAYHYPTNMTQSKKYFKYCCNNGKYLLENTQYPQLLKDLFEQNHPKSANFLKNIRSYNAALALAFLHYETKNHNLKGAPFVSIFGQYCVVTPTSLTNSSDSKFSQLYFIESQIASKQRQNAPPNKLCDKELLQELDILLRNINPYCSILNSIKVLAKPEEIDDIEVYFFNTQNKETNFNSLANNEIACVHTGKDGLVPEEYDFKVFVKQQTKELTYLKPSSENTMPLVYILFFPFVDKGWTYNK